jgi:hypothetical protein
MTVKYGIMVKFQYLLSIIRSLEGYIFLANLGRYIKGLFSSFYDVILGLLFFK